MNLIHFQGLNCYHDCVLSIVNHFGLNYPAAFATLWSETDFRYDQYREAYLTKRMISNLEVMGTKIECFDCFSPGDAEEKLAVFSNNQFMIIGMDAFYIPWNQFYQTFHGPHYFIAQNTKTETLFCYDPTYNKKNEQITLQEIIAHTFDVCRISRVVQNPLRIEMIDQAREIVLTHAHTRQRLLSRIHDCVHGTQESIILLAKYIDAMICNRYLYRVFLENQSAAYNKDHLFFSRDYFVEWEAVKNGLYKASVSRDKESIIADICDYLNRRIDAEIVMAEKIISGD